MGTEDRQSRHLPTGWEAMHASVPREPWADVAIRSGAHGKFPLDFAGRLSSVWAESRSIRPTMPIAVISPAAPRSKPRRGERPVAQLIGVKRLTEIRGVAYNSRAGLVLRVLQGIVPTRKGSPWLR
jgi:hypothetical protein